MRFNLLEIRTMKLAAPKRFSGTPLGWNVTVLTVLTKRLDEILNTLFLAKERRDPRGL